MYLASGVAHVPEMREKGIPVALATDGPGSNNNQDMLELLKTTALLHKVNTLDAGRRAAGELPADALLPPYRPVARSPISLRWEVTNSTYSIGMEPCRI